MLRFLVSIFCVVAIPTLLVWANSGWTKVKRQELPHWRNGIGLAAITLIFAGWSMKLLGLGLILFKAHADWPSFQTFGWYWGHMEIYFLPLALLLALGMKGLPRLHVFTAGLLLWVLTASFIYT